MTMGICAHAISTMDGCLMLDDRVRTDFVFLFIFDFINDEFDLDLSRNYRAWLVGSWLWTFTAHHKPYNVINRKKEKKKILFNHDRWSVDANYSALATRSGILVFFCVQRSRRNSRVAHFRCWTDADRHGRMCSRWKLVHADHKIMAVLSGGNVMPSVYHRGISRAPILFIFNFSLIHFLVTQRTTPRQALDSLWTNRVRSEFPYLKT